MTCTTNFPKTHSGTISWVKSIPLIQPGDVLQLPGALYATAPGQLRRLGVHCTSRRQGNEIIITIAEVPPTLKKSNGQSLTEIAAAESRHANLDARIREALENALYWQRQAELRTNHQARLDALARQAAWKMTATRLQQQLSTKNTTVTP